MADLTFEQLMERKRPQEQRVKIPLTPAMRAELVEAQKAVDKFTRLAGARLLTEDQQDEVAEAEERLEAIEAAIDADSVEFVFRALGREDFEELVKQYPPTPEQRTKLREEMKRQGLPRSRQVGPMWDLEKFPPALMAAVCISPSMTFDQAVELWDSDKFNQAELQVLFEAALEVQTTVSRS